MAIKKVRTDFWEGIFEFPTFNIRFISTLSAVLLAFIFVGYLILFRLDIITGTSDQIAALNLIIQSATLVLGAFATYYALRQLVETRFNSLDESGMQELKRGHYSRAFDKWREAFYIRPDASVFINMSEALLLVGDYDTFDQYVQMSQQRSFSKRQILAELSDQILVLYLRAARHLIVKNQGEANLRIAEIIELIKNNNLPSLNWDFIDLQRSDGYSRLDGECKVTLDNLISYLQNTMITIKKEDFESGHYASILNEPIPATPNP